MGSDEQHARATQNKILRPKLLLVSAALVALIVAAPAADPTSALAMDLGSSGFGRISGPTHISSGTFNGGSLNNGVHVSTGGMHVVPGNVGGATVGNGHEIGVIGRVGQGSSGNPCNPGRVSSVNQLNRLRCGPGTVVVNNGGDHPDNGGGTPRHPEWRSVPPRHSGSGVILRSDHDPRRPAGARRRRHRPPPPGSLVPAQPAAEPRPGRDDSLRTRLARDAPHGPRATPARPIRWGILPRFPRPSRCSARSLAAAELRSDQPNPVAARRRPS